MADLPAVEAALAGLRSGYEADGYDLVVEAVNAGVVAVRISAGPDACADCLVPRPIAIGTIQASLAGFPEITGVTLTYPAETPH